MSKRFVAGDRSLIAQIENNFDSNAPVQQICRSELDLRKISTGKRSLEDGNNDERTLKQLKLQSEIDDRNAVTEKKRAETKKIEADTKAIDRKSEEEAKKTEAAAKAIDRKSEAEANAIDRKSEAEANAILVKAEAEARAIILKAEEETKTKQIKAEAEAKAIILRAEEETKTKHIKAEAEAKKIVADANKTNADAEKTRIQANNSLGQEFRRNLDAIELCDQKAMYTRDDEQQRWKNIATQAKIKLCEFLTQQPADREP